jgi:hypothetical protein
LKFYREHKKKEIVFVISDFMSEDYEQTVTSKTRHHRHTRLRYSRRKMPDLGMVSMMPEQELSD